MGWPAASRPATALTSLQAAQAAVRPGVRNSGLPFRPHRAQAGTARTDPRAMSSAASLPAAGGAPCRIMSGSAASAEASSRSAAGFAATASTASAAVHAGSVPSTAMTCRISVSRRHRGQAGACRVPPGSSWPAGQRAVTARRDRE
jgi:hypothetical protein